MLTSFRTFDHLYAGSGLPLSDVCSLLARQARAVLRPEPRT
jgi:hypothetical protein